MIVVIPWESTLKDVQVDGGDARLTINVKTFQDGEQTSQEVSELFVRNGSTAETFFERHFEADRLGYVEISITADRSYFRKIYADHAYGVVVRSDGGNFNVNSSFKFSDPATIDMIRKAGLYCLVHPAQFVSRSKNVGNSTLIVNPFDGPIVARFSTGPGTEMRKRIAPRHVALISLGEIVEDDQWTCVLFTGNNRFPAWDVRHAYDDEKKINRVDHLEYYRGDLTLRPLPFRRFLWSRVKRSLRALGIQN
jgi:hypothetical protein